jgi:O-antigen ligase
MSEGRFSKLPAKVCLRDMFCGSVLAIFALYPALVYWRFAAFGAFTLGLVSLVVLELALHARNGLVIRSLKSVSALLLLIGWALLSSQWSMNASVTLESGSILIAFAGIAFLAASVREEVKGQLVAALAVVWTVALCGQAVFLLLEFGSIRTISRSMGDATGGNWGNRLANSLAMTLPLLWYGFGRGYLNRAVFATCLLASSAVVALSASRGGTLAFVLALSGSFTMLLRFGKVRLRRNFETVAAAVALAAGLVILLFLYTDVPSQLVQRFVDTDFRAAAGYSPASEAESDYARASQARLGWELVFNPTLLGIGYYSFGFLLEQRYGIYVSAHNIFFIVLGELGIVGAVLSLAGIVALAVRWLRKRRDKATYDQMLYAFLGLVLLLGLVIFFWRPQQANPLLWFVFGSIVGVRKPKTPDKAPGYL